MSNFSFCQKALCMRLHVGKGKDVSGKLVKITKLGIFEWEEIGNPEVVCSLPFLFLHRSGEEGGVVDDAPESDSDINWNAVEDDDELCSGL